MRQFVLPLLISISLLSACVAKHEELAPAAINAKGNLVITPKNGKHRLMGNGGTIMPPAGFRDFCNRDPEECK